MSRNTAGVPYKNPTRYVGPGANLVPVVKNPRAPTTSDKQHNLMTIWLVGPSPTTGTEGDLWYLAEYKNGDAIWKQFDTGAGGVGVDFLRDQVDAQVGPDGSGNIDLNGLAVANGANPSGIPLETVADAGNNAIAAQIQVAAAITGAPGDKNDAGIASFDDTAFDVDADGYVTLKGGAGPAIDTVDIDGATGPGTDPVAADGSGQIAINGLTTANATRAKPVFTHSGAANAFDIEVQVGAAVSATPGDKNDAGMLSMDNIYFNVDSNGFTSVEERLLQQPVGTTYNLGLAYSSPIGKITSSDGTALSATNPGFVVVQSVTHGLKVVHTITSDITFEDDSGTSVFTGNTWDTTSGTAWSSAMPFYIYAVAEDSDASATFMISRVPHRTSSPAAGNIAKSGSAVASTQGSFFALDSGVTVADFDSNPAVAVGSLRMVKNDGGNDDWTIQALTTADGFGLFQEGKFFTLPKSQNGASADNLSSSVGGDTLPTFNSTAALSYTVSKNGFCHFYWVKDTVTGNGSGSGLLRLHVPFIFAFSSTWSNAHGNWNKAVPSGSNWDTGTLVQFDQQKYYEFLPSGSGVAKLTPGSISSTTTSGINVSGIIAIDVG